jgi:acyl-CoA hydrolase
MSLIGGQVTSEEGIPVRTAVRVHRTPRCGLNSFEEGDMMEPWKQRFAPKLVSAEEAAAHLKNGDRIYLGSMCSEPRTIIRAMRNSLLSNVSMLQFLNGSEAASLAKTAPQNFSLKTFFRPRRTDESDRQSDADYMPLFHSQIPDFFRRRRIPIDVAIVQVSPPDRFGRFSLGIAVDISLAAVESARMVIAQVNPLMPWTLGDTFIPGEMINYLVEGARISPNFRRSHWESVKRQLVAIVVNS